jgi:hypothetical protein
MRLLVCGGRTYADATKANRCLDAIHAKHIITLLIEGDAAGADRLGKLWAIANGVPLATYPAKWREEGRAAGPRRNARMLLDGRPEAALALGGDAGTADMIRRCREANVPVWEVDR